MCEQCDKTFLILAVYDHYAKSLPKVADDCERDEKGFATPQAALDAMTPESNPEAREALEALRDNDVEKINRMMKGW